MVVRLLVELYVENVALVRRARVPFGPGLNVLTGETGAGKSLILDALGLAVGLRGLPEGRRGQEEPVRVDALFELPADHPVAARLAAMGFEGDGGQWVLGRELGRGGRGRARINGRPVTLAELAQVGEWLVSIHTQHDSHRLLRPSVQLELLDAFAGEQTLRLREQVQALHASLRSATQEWESLQTGERQRLQEMDLLRYQVEEIAAAGLREGEEEALTAEYTRLAAADRLRELLASAVQELAGGPAAGGEGWSAREAMGRAEALLAEAVELDGRVAGPLAQLRAAGEQLAEAARELRWLADQAEPDPQRLHQLGQRLELLGRLQRKYGPTVAAVLAYLEQARARLAELERWEDRSGALREELARLEAQYEQACRQLSQLRRQAARQLGERVQGELAELAMPKARFEVRVGPAPAGPTGRDEVEFLFSAHSGEAPRPLAQVASGGELSRTMLACRTVLAAADPVPVLIFDEPDTGLGGRAAQAVGERLARLGRNRQVLVVTHLPQVASLADHHLAVVKQERDGRPWVEVQPLDRRRQVDELARMLGGARITETALRHAEELLRLAQDAKATG